MKCPACDSTKIHTYDTRRVEDKVVRKRRCTNCEERFYTLEQYMSEEELEEVQELRRSNGRKVLYRVSDSPRHQGGNQTQVEVDSAMDMPELSGEEESESVREGGD